ncbi:hypothetical protein EW145_g7889 [Phellinidium pouzarii]|uniref:Reverse transcriptase domain-containing protein n=1 Tax=Phellinidium pouzarii TaxID=167371 RepID=A0A4S4KEG7_9AGAM|nr:hypothetical protein EW145_g7889 [Phellinidium pouzarii]
MRPIVPCHSALQNPAAKFVSKMLKPIITSLIHCPYVIHGTKDFVQKLQHLPILNKKTWIVSGDVVAYYPNIPKSEAIRRTVDFYANYYVNQTTPGSTSVFIQALQLAMNRLIFDFEGVTYQQLRGLAMGVACSPDIANLYGAYYEKDIMKDTEDILMYGRYIDDVFAIVYAESSSAALSLVANRLKIGPCEITWEVTEWGTPFLDLFVFVDPITRRIQHKPFRKAHNHTERVPWASFHPIDVKRGTFLGEMSRLATLCSQPKFYLEAMTELAALYVARGYPIGLIKAWLRENLLKRWKQRLDPKPVEGSGHDKVFVLKTIFNPAWNGFNVNKLRDIVTETWVTNLPTEKWVVTSDGVLDPWDNTREDIPIEDRDQTPGSLDLESSDQPEPLLASPASTSSAEVNREMYTPGFIKNPQTGDLERIKVSYDKAGKMIGDVALYVASFGPQIPASEFYGKQHRSLSPPRGEGPSDTFKSFEETVPQSKVSMAKRVTGPKSLAYRFEPASKPGASVAYVMEPMFDITKSDFLSRRWLVSWKRTSNLGDLASMWRKNVLETARRNTDDLDQAIMTLIDEELGE